MSDDPRDRLEEAGRRPAPPPDPDFADRLEARLLAVARTAAPTPEPGGPRPSRGRRRRWFALGGATIGVLALLVLVAVGVPGQGPRPELAQPANVEVALRDGTVLEDPDGLLLPDGAVVTVGDGGFARIGDTVLLPGDVATIEHGRVEVEHDQPIGVVSGTASPGPHPAPQRTPAPPHGTPTPRAPTPAPAPGGSPRPSSAPRTPSPSPSPRPAPTPPPATPEPVATPTPPTVAPSPTPTPVQRTARPRLRARLIADGAKVAVRWTETRRARSYVLLVTRSRVGSAPDPVYPGSTVLHAFAHPPAVAFRFRILPRVTEVRVLVVALGKNGQEVSRSRIVVLPTGNG